MGWVALLLSIPPLRSQCQLSSSQQNLNDCLPPTSLVEHKHSPPATNSRRSTFSSLQDIGKRRLSLERPPSIFIYVTAFGRKSVLKDQYLLRFQACRESISGVLSLLLQLLYVLSLNDLIFDFALHVSNERC